MFTPYSTYIDFQDVCYYFFFVWYMRLHLFIIYYYYIKTGEPNYYNKTYIYYIIKILNILYFYHCIWIFENTISESSYEGVSIEQPYIFIILQVYI